MSLKPFTQQSQKPNPNPPQPNNTSKIIQHLRKVQFICQFFILSKVDQSHDSVPQLLMIIQAVKFYFKSLAVAQSKGIYIENVQNVNEGDKEQEQVNELMQIQEKSTVDQERQLDRQRRLLELIKNKPYQNFNYYPQTFEQMSNGKKMQMITAVKIPKQLQKTQLKFRHILGQLLTVLRPLISIICIRLFGIESYKSYFVSLFIDIAIILIFQRGLKVTSNQQVNEMKRRKNQMIMRYLFRKPFFLLLKKIILEPVLAKIVKPSRIVSKIIMSLLEMQSSISLTL